jgi:uncharacterized protein (DUF2141 family)
MERLGWISVLALALTAPALAEKAEAPTTEKPADEIFVEVTGLENNDGQIGCAIFDEEKGFPDEANKALEQIFIKPKSKKATCVFKDYKPGTYAISVMHDTDMNGELNKSMVGRPKEPWGVSRNAPAQRFGPPAYEDCKLEYAGGKKTLKVKLQK